MKNKAQVEPSAWSLAEEAPEVTDLGSLCAPATKKAPPGVMAEQLWFPAGVCSRVWQRSRLKNPGGTHQSRAAHSREFVWLPPSSREGNGTRLQYSCLENPRDGGAWWAAVCGVAQSRTPLKRLSSSSSSLLLCFMYKSAYIVDLVCNLFT